MVPAKVSAQPQTKLSVEPSTYPASLLNEVFTINISVTNIQYFVAFDFKLGYNTTILDALDAVEGPFLVDPYLAVAINETEGYLRIWGSCGRTSGNGTVAIIDFKATYGKSSSCILDLYDTTLFALPPFGFNITQVPHDVEDGYYEFVTLGVTVGTNKPYYLPGENISIYGNLTKDGQPIQGVVALEVDNPSNWPIVVRTFQMNSTPSPEEVSILEIYTSNEWGDPKTSFKRNPTQSSDICYVHVKVKNNHPTETKDVTITANSYDINMVPLIAIGTQGTVGANKTWSANIQISIPEWASLGNATVYVNVFNHWPGRGPYGDRPQYGIPYCPERNATFEITDGGQGAGGSGTLGSSSNYGTYNLTFKLPTSTRAGIYRVYATSSPYQKQVIHNSTVFGVNAIYVPDHYVTIQEAVDAATPTNNSILVLSGTYNEHVVINKSLILVGVEPTNTLINGSLTGTVITITEDNVEISRFTIQNSGNSFPDSGITLNNSSNSTINENTILNDYNGIYITNSSQENVIRDNDLNSNNGYGVSVQSSNNNEISGNTLSNNNYGIYINKSTGATLRDNNMIDNKYNFGVFGDSISDFIHDVDASNTVDGKPVVYWISQQDKVVPPNAGYVAIVNSANITVRGLNLTKNGQGVLFAFTTNSLIERVNTTKNEYGIYLDHSYNTIIIGSEISNSSVGIHQRYCNGNIICHNNFSNNTNQVDIYQSSDTWNDDVGKGNFWSNYAGADDGSNNRTAGDGVGDTLLPHQGVDWYPLMNPWIPMHDVAIINVTYVLPCDESQLYPGWVIDVTATIQNEGDFTETLNITAYYNGNLIQMKTVTELTPLNEIAINLTWDTEGVPPGNYTISAHADQVPGEIDTTDNTYINGNITLLVPTIHDLNVTSVTPIIPHNYSHVCTGWVINTIVTIKNEGHFKETTNLTAYYNESIIDTKIITLYPLANTSITLVWYTDSVPRGNYTITANATQVQGETDTTDNTSIDGMIHVILKGDVNDNGIINVGDMLALKIAIAQGKTVEQLPFYDLDGNGLINVGDMLQLKIVLMS